jgi:fructokinase
MTQPSSARVPALGIDLGGTKVEVVALEPDGREHLRRRIATPHEDYEAIVGAIGRLVDEAERDLGLAPGTCRVGVGTPGSPSPTTRLLRNSNSVCLNRRPLQADIEARLRRSIVIANDANCFVLSEARDGAGAGAAVVFGIILGTGVGGGWVVEGKLVQGQNAIAGEWGHNPLPWPRDDERPGALCFCGRHGCIETFLSGPGLARDHERVTGLRLSGPEIVAQAAAGEAQCRATLDRYEERLARALAHAMNMLDPDVIVLGGGLSNIPGLGERVAARWAPWVFSDAVTTRVVKATHGDSSGVRGAAWLAMDRP